MTTTGRPADNARLTVDQVTAVTRSERNDLLRGIDNRALLARQERGEWVVLARHMRRWLPRL